MLVYINPSTTYGIVIVLCIFTVVLGSIIVKVRTRQAESWMDGGGPEEWVHQAGSGRSRLEADW